jgi:hypothetical protein
MIDPVQQVFREIPAASAVPQVSSRRDRELQMEEGRPPMEVASAEQQALYWRKAENLQDKWHRGPARKDQRRAVQGAASEEGADETQEEATEGRPEGDEQGDFVAPQQIVQEVAESSEEESTGTLFDGRS